MRTRRAEQFLGLGIETFFVWVLFAHKKTASLGRRFLTMGLTGYSLTGRVGSIGSRLVDATAVTMASFPLAGVLKIIVSSNQQLKNDTKS